MRGLAQPRQGFFTGLRRDRNIQLITAAIAIVLLGAPVIMVVLGAFRNNPFGESEWTAKPLLTVLADPSTHDALWTTFSMGVVVVLISMTGAVIFATLATRSNTPLRTLIPAIMALVVATPSLFSAIAWGMLGNKTVGLINIVFGIAGTDAAINIESWWGIVFVAASRSMAFQFFLLLGPFASMDRRLEEAARVSGAGAVRTFFGTQLPTLFPAIAGVAIMSIIVFLESFEIPQILGVPAGIYVLPTEIFSYLEDVSGYPRYAEASSVALILMVILVILVVVQNKVMGRRSFATISGKGSDRQRWDLGGWKWLSVTAIIAYATIAVLLPAMQLVLASFARYIGAPPPYTFDNYIRVFNDSAVLGAFGTSFFVAVLTATLATAGSVLILWVGRLRRGVLAQVIDFSQWLVLAIPGLILALGVLWLIVPIPGLNQLYGTPVILIYALVLAVIPLIGRAVAGAFAQLPADLEEAAWISGSSRTRAVMAIVVRLTAPSLLNGWLLCFIVASGALAVPLLLSTPSSTLISVEVYAHYTAGNPGIAAVIFVLLLLEFCAVAALVGLLKMFIAKGGHSGQRRAATPAASAPAEVASTEQPTLTPHS